MSLVDKVVAITGAASGIGLATAKIAAAKGAKLALADIGKENLEAAKKFFDDAKTPCLATVVDTSKSAEVDAWISETIKHFGRLDGAANCAGIGNHRTPAIVDHTDEDWHMVQDVNLNGVFWCVRAELRVMAEHGSIVNISSVAGMRAFPWQASYCAAKHGVIGLSKTAAAEVGHRNIRVNAICPGYIDTALTRNTPTSGKTGELLQRWIDLAPLKRAGSAEEVGQLVCWLLSGDSSFVTGGVYTVDGGMNA